MHLGIANEDQTAFRRAKSAILQWWFNMALEEFIQSYRKKLGSYDIKPWERAMEASVRQKQNLSETPKRPTKLKPELIDVDLVRGSTFPKEKSQFPWTFFTGDSISHVIFLPLRSQWWIEQTTEPVFYLLTALYFLQIFSLITWVSSLSLASPTEEWISASETLTPLMLMFIVSEILTQAKRHDEISATHAFESVSDDASVDFDDLASLSDRSCRSSSPGDGASLDRGYVFSFPGQISGKNRRKAKRRPSRSNAYGNEEFLQWQMKLNNGVFTEEQRHSLEQIGHLLIGLPPKRQSLKGDETTDSGLFLVGDEPAAVKTFPPGLRMRLPTRSSLPRIDSDQSHPAQEDDDIESDVSDMELNGWKAAHKKPLDDSTSDKEATDDDTLLQPPPRIKLEFAPTSSTCSVTDDDDVPLDRDHVHIPQSAATEQPIGCTIWESLSFSFHKTDLSVYEITNCIVKKAENSPVIGSSRLALAILPVAFALLPVCHGIFRTFHPGGAVGPGVKKTSLSHLLRLEGTWTDWSVVIFKANGIVQRYFWGFWFFLLLAVAFETYQQRYLVAKYFGYLTSSRRAKRANLPHFRLSKVRNVKSWLCVRSCLKKYGPRKSVDVVVSFSCLSCLICVIFTCFMVVNAEVQFTSNIYVWESMLWLFAVGLFLLRFMVLGSKTNQKFRNSSVLTTEQLNLYLRMEQKPHKKDQLMLVNNVLKLAADLIKEIEHPCKISGFPANPFLYNISRLLILSAFSTLISEICGFKLKLYKLKM